MEESMEHVRDDRTLTAAPSAEQCPFVADLRRPARDVMLVERAIHAPSGLWTTNLLGWSPSGRVYFPVRIEPTHDGTIISPRFTITARFLTGAAAWHAG